MSIIIFLIILALLILVHEFGHFIVAKKADIRVDEFGIGFPPRIFGKLWQGTIYSINAIPFGGFVRIFGEDPSEEARTGKDSVKSFINKPRFTQAAVLGAGVAFNLIMGWGLLAISFMSAQPSFADALVQTAHSSETTVIMNVQENSPAERAGLKAGDVVVRMNVLDGSNLIDISPVSISNFIQVNQGSIIHLDIERNGEILSIETSPEEGVVDGKHAIGILTGLRANALSLPMAIIEAGKTTFELSGLFAVSLVSFLVSALQGSADLSQVTGPVGIVAFGSQAVGIGFSFIAGFAAIISINLAVINLLPIPALDGGRLFFLLIEIIKRKPLNPKVINIFNSVGFAILILLMLVVTYNDIIRMF
jgi:regulator of sigma E protease